MSAGRGDGGSREAGSSIARDEHSRLAQRLTSVGLHQRALEVAIEEDFAGGFTRESWRQVWEATAPRDMNRAEVIRGNYSSIVNNVTEILKSAAGKRLIALLEHRRPHTKDAINAVRDDGGLTAAQARRLHELVVFEGRLEHMSPNVNADEVFEAVEMLRHELPGLIKNISGWLSKHGITFN